MSFTTKNNLTYQCLNDLVTALTHEEKAKYTNIFQMLDLPNSAFEPFCSWSTESYTRNCLVDTGAFELILLCWEAGQCTPIHDHGGEECWVKIIEGEFKETIYQMGEKGELNKVKSTILKPGDISYMIDFMGCHSLENCSSKRSMSLHLYAKPIRTCQSYDDDLQEFVNKDLSYCTVA